VFEVRGSTVSTVNLISLENKCISGYIFWKGLGVILHMVMVMIAKSRICYNCVLDSYQLMIW
jgi:hypothetical protein